MERGILMEVRGRQGVLMTGTGEFKSVPLPAGAWQVGDEIATQVRPAGRRWLRPVVAAAAAILVLVGGPTGYWQWSLLQPSVVLAMEINPSLEFTINGKGNVTAARGLNPDGQVVLQAILWKNLPIDQVVKAATTQAVAMGKLDPGSADGAIVVTVTPVKGEKLPDDKAQAITLAAETAAQAAVNTAATAQGKEPHAQVKVVSTTAAEAAEAKAVGLTSPEYAILKYAQETHPDLNLKPESFQNKGPGAVIKELGLTLSEVFPSSSKGRGQDDPTSHEQGSGRSIPSGGQGQNDNSGGNKPQENSNKPQESSNKPQESSNKPQENSNKPQDNGNKPQDNGNKSGGILDSLFGRGGLGADDNPGAASGKGGPGSGSNPFSGGQLRPEDRSGSSSGLGKGNNSGGGTFGKSWDTGNSGDSGKNGNTGKSGESGRSGNSGNSGESGRGGNSGNSGNSGKSGGDNNGRDDGKGKGRSGKDG